MLSIFAFIVVGVGLGRIGSVSAYYEQCGGQGWTGSTTCANGGCCTFSNPYYSQCLPCASTPANPVTTSTSVATSTRTVSTTQSNPVTSVTSATKTSGGAAPTGTQIRSDQDPTFHFYLQNQNNTAVLGPVGSSGYFKIAGSIQISSGQYLNLADTASTYKQLVFGSTPNFSGWTLEGDTIITSQSSTYGRQLNFMVCATSSSSIYTVYLQLGNDSPPGLTCAKNNGLHLPCLC